MTGPLSLDMHRSVTGDSSKISDKQRDEDGLERMTPLPNLNDGN